MIRFVAAVLLCAGPALADPPFSSLRPLPRGGETAEKAAQTVVSTRGNVPLAGPDSAGDFPVEARPKPRPARAGGILPALVDQVALRPAARPPAATEQRTMVRVIRGPLAHEALQALARPAHIARLVKEQATLSEVRYAPKGSICGVNAIKGRTIGTFGRPGKGCGIANPVKVTSIHGIALSRSATMDCGTAKALDSWVQKGLTPAIGARGGGVKQIKIVADYACRNRNNARSGRLSEHAKGRAVDIAGVTLRDGTYVSVLKGWRSKAWSTTLRVMHKAACGPFGTVLGPNANAYHRDHFHFDTARYRAGSYCR